MRDHRKYYVFNPTTKQFAIIRSVIGGLTARKAICFMGLAFHQTDRVHFKLVCVRCLKRNEGLFQIQVYSSETKKWKIAIESFSEREPVFEKGVYWNGAVYWAPYRGRYFCFKIDVEQLQTLPLSEGLVPSKVNTWYFGESRGHLHLILPMNREERGFIVYEMLRDHSGWFAKYQIQLDEIMTAYLEIGNPYGLFYDLTVIDVVRGETEEDTYMVLHSKAKIITYNVHDKNCKLIFTLPKNFSEHYGHKILTYEDFFEDFPCFHRYIETLTSL
ncbi:F-box protein At5g07610-like [Bidens hawaiensis]|uniref:F-box protein At5g07610-like n=1 Tax=Bidens hawaiensis TaxID=980011 RepID=UPI00404AD8C3